MSIQITCPDCSKAASVPDNLMGKRVRCPHCKQPILAQPPGLVASAEAVAAQPPPRRLVPPSLDDVEDQPRKPRRDELVPPPLGAVVKKQKKVGSFMRQELIYALVFLFVSCCGGILFFGVRTGIGLWSRSAFSVPSDKIDTPQNDEQLTKALANTNDGDGGRRADAFNAIARANIMEHRRGEVTARALTCANDAHGGARDAARNVVRKWAGKDNVPALIELVDNHDNTVRHLSIEVLGKLKDPRAAGPIAMRLGPDREQASKALRELGPMAESAVLQCVKDDDAGVRREACVILKRIGTTTLSEPVLQKVQSGDRDNGVKAAAKDALATIRERGKK